MKTDDKLEELERPSESGTTYAAYFDACFHWGVPHWSALGVQGSPMASVHMSFSIWLPLPSTCPGDSGRPHKCRAWRWEEAYRASSMKLVIAPN